MSSRPIIEPKSPSRERVLEMIDDKGRDKWRNPVHLKGIHGGWPHSPQTDEGKQMKIQAGMETKITGEKGPVK